MRSILFYFCWLFFLLLGAAAASSSGFGCGCGINGGHIKSLLAAAAAAAHAKLSMAFVVVVVAVLLVLLWLLLVLLCSPCTASATWVSYVCVCAFKCHWGSRNKISKIHGAIQQQKAKTELQMRYTKCYQKETYIIIWFTSLIFLFCSHFCVATSVDSQWNPLHNW